MYCRFVKTLGVAVISKLLAVEQNKSTLIRPRMGKVCMCIILDQQTTVLKGSVEINTIGSFVFVLQ